MNTCAKIGKNEVAEITAKYHGGQQIFRRASVSALLKYVSELEARLTLRPPDDGYCVCGGEGYVMLLNGAKVCNLCKRHRR